MLLPLETAAKIAALYQSMPDEVREDYRSRILNGDNLRPVLLEIDIAAHHYQKNHNVAWPTRVTWGRARIPDLLIKTQNCTLEIECKSHGVDTGRKIARPRFYQLVDLLAPAISRKGYRGEIKITIADELSNSQTWQQGLVAVVTQSVGEGPNNIITYREAKISLNLEKKTGEVVNVEFIRSVIEPNLREFSHVCIFAPSSNGGKIVDPLAVIIDSESSDGILLAILDDLRDKNGQFSGENPSVISCFVPEITSFEKLKGSSGLSKMTTYFFEKYARDCVHSVSYLSDAMDIKVDNIHERPFPALTYRNPHCRFQVPDNVIFTHVSPAAL